MLKQCATERPPEEPAAELQVPECAPDHEEDLSTLSGRLSTIPDYLPPWPEKIPLAQPLGMPQSCILASCMCCRVTSLQATLRSCLRRMSAGHHADTDVQLQLRQFMSFA